jgi:TonB-linked SusC/RagA family outer membrane protein
MKKFTKANSYFLFSPHYSAVGFIKSRLITYMICGFSFLGVGSYAQTMVTGTVMDARTGIGIPGANVVVAGTTQGTITNSVGFYSVNVSDPAAVLTFSFIGYKSETLSLEGKTELDVILSEDLQGLDEVVVIGYGTVKKSDLTGSVSVVSTKELTKNPAVSAAQALQGKAPGVLVSQSGKPGAGPTIRIRGVGSINNGSDPIYIVDGVEVGNIDNIQPQDIESLQVLKDASASAIYGANGSNGVIIVTTKRGKSGKPQVNLNSYIGLSMAPKRYDVMNADQYSAFYSKLYGAKPEYEQAFREKYYGAGWRQGTDWQSEMFKNGLTQNHNLSISGGGDNSNYSVSFGYVKDAGTVIKSNAERYNLRANSDFKLSDYVKIGESFSLNYSTGEDPIVVQTSIWELNTSPLMKIHNPYYKGGFENYQANYWEDAEGNLKQGRIPDGYTGPVYSNTLGNDKPNLLTAPSLGQNKNYGLGSLASVYMQIDFTKSLTFKITPAAEIYHSRSKSWLPLFEGNRSPGQASLNEGYSEGMTLNLENQLSFKRKFNDVHNLQATAVYLMRSGQDHSISGAENGFDFEQLNTLANGGTASTSLKGYESDSRMLSYLGRVMYDYKGTYFLTASYRSDGVSVFAPAFRRGNFASASVAWKVNEVFLKDIQEIDALKLRFGWGQTGNSSIGGGFQYLDKISENTNFSPVFGADQHIARAQYVFYGFASKEIHWEAAEMLNIGIDLNLFDSKIQSSLEYYVKNNKDLLVAIPISSAFGRQDGNPWFNTGNIQNRGLEFSLQWRDNIGAFNYGINSNFTTIKNEVMYLPVTDITSGNNRTIEGHSIGALYGYVSEGIIQLNESNYTKDAEGNWQTDASGFYTGYKHSTHLGNTPQPGDIRYSDLNGDGDVTALDKTIVGKTIPSFTYTLGFDCSYKGFDLNLFLFGVNDFDVFNSQRALLSSMNSQDMDHNKLNDFANNHWTVENASTTHVRLDPSNRNVNDQMSSFWIEDGSFLRIKDLQLGYTLAKNYSERLGVSRIRIFANASNLYCLTKYQGRDPESFISSDPLNSGTDNGSYSIPRSFVGGLQIEF